MGLLSTLGKAAFKAVKNLDKIDTVTELSNIVPDKLDQIKKMVGKGHDMVQQHRINKLNKLQDSIMDLSNQISKLNAKQAGYEYESKVQILEEKKLTLVYAIPPQYDSMSPIGNNMFSAQLNNKWGIIDINNQIIIPFEYDFILAADYGGNDDYIFPVEKDGSWGYINMKNEIVLDFTFSDAGVFQQGLASVGVNTEKSETLVYGYIDKTGEFVIPAKYDYAFPFTQNNCATVGVYDVCKEETFYGVINSSGAIVVNCRYDNIRYEPEYIAGVHIGKDSDFYDYKGVPLTLTDEMKEKEEEIKKEENMMPQAIICKRNKGVKDKIIPYFTSDLICGYFIETDSGCFCKIEPVFEEAYNVNKWGYARVKFNGLYGVINLNEQEG